MTAAAGSLDIRLTGGIVIRWLPVRGTHMWVPMRNGTVIPWTAVPRRTREQMGFDEASGENLYHVPQAPASPQRKRTHRKGSVPMRKKQ